MRAGRILPVMESQQQRGSAFLLSAPLANLTRGERKFTLKMCSLDSDKSETGRRKESSRRRRPRPRASQSARSIHDVSVGDEFIGKVCDVGPADSTWLDIDVATSTGKAVRARLPHRKSSVAREVTDVVGGVIPVRVRKMNRYAGRIEVSRGVRQARLKKLPPKEWRKLESLAVGEKFTGEVVGTGAYGAVVDIDVFRTGKRGRVVPSLGLLPRKMFRQGWACDADLIVRDNVDRIIRIGDQVDVFVRTVNSQNAFLLLDSAHVSADALERERAEKTRTMRQRHRRRSLDTLVAGEARKGRVTNLAKFGVFVDIGVKKDGLIHYSDMGPRHRGDWKETVGVGMEVAVEILQVMDNRISLKLLSLEDEAEKEAASKASSPTARLEDLARAEALGLDVSGSGLMVTDGSQGSNSAEADKTRRGRQRRDDVVKLRADEQEEDDGDGDGDEDGNGDEDGDENEVEVFSDEYFEERYGY